jgi:transcription elongation factor GreA
MSEILVTDEGFQQLKEELNALKTIDRTAISERIRIARGFGDLSENSEYDEAKNAQALLEARIQILEDQLKRVRIIDKDQISTNEVSVGTLVVLSEIVDGVETEPVAYRIVSAVEGNGIENTITSNSPVGRALLGRRTGDLVLVKAPKEDISFKIVSISI